MLGLLNINSLHTVLRHFKTGVSDAVGTGDPPLRESMVNSFVGRGSFWQIQADKHMAQTFSSNRDIEHNCRRLAQEDSTTEILRTA